jgi:hypothetical protein
MGMRRRYQGEPRGGSHFPRRAALVSLFALVALLVTPAAVADPPVLSGVPGDQVLEAVSSAGAPFSWPDPTATDPDGNPTTVACSPPAGTTFPIATTTVTCTATDTVSLEETSQSFTVTVQDTTPPTVDVPGGITTEATGPGGAVVTFSASASDIVDGSVATGCAPASGGSFGLGTTTVTCSATDAHGNTGSNSFSVTVQDTGPPSLTVPGDITAPATGPGGAVVTFSASASDLVDASPTVICAPPSGSLFPIGPTTVTCTATDDSGNSAGASFTVTVQDTTPPSVTVPGAITAEATGPGGAVVTYSVSAFDLVDLTPNVSCAPPSGSTFAIAETTVSCTATDDSGNTSAAKTFAVTVRDTTPPSVTVPGDIVTEATGPNGALVAFSASASDIVSGGIEPVCSPSSGGTFPLGTTAVTCTATDSRGNAAKGTFIVSVRDTSPPTFSAVPTGVVSEADGRSGSRVTYVPPPAVDVVSGPVLVACAPGPGALFPLGVTTVACTAQDARKNGVSASFTVSVVDRAKPALNVPQPQTVSSRGAATLARGDSQVAAFLSAAAAADIVDGAVPVLNDAPAVLPVGTTRVTFTATDRAGNRATDQSELTVVTAAVTPKAQDTTPPKDVTQLKARSGDRFVLLTWVAPKADFDHVTIARSPGRGEAPSTVVYRGSGKQLMDRSLTNGVEYRYVVVAHDVAGNVSPGAVVRAIPNRPLLYAPAQGTVVSKPPVLRWARVAGATYYNAQVYRAPPGRASALGTKILSAWPVRPQIALTWKWKLNGRTQRLTPGTYHWFVWPGLGAKSANRYGPVLGQSTFVVKPQV